MFAAPRILVIDDKRVHLDAISEAFRQLGSPCLGIHFDPARDMDRSHFRGVRHLFADLHLIDAGASSDHRPHFALIANLLENNIHPDGGPFMLVVWTQHAQLSNALKDYLDANLAADKPYARPVAVLALDKTRYINVNSGSPLSPEAVAALRADVMAAIGAVPQLQALLDWESDVLAASGATLSTLLSLVPPAQRTSAEFPGALDDILSRLAREAVGKSNVAADPRAAITSALAPILSDRIVNQQPGAASVALWAQAVTRQMANAPDLSPEEAGRINRMLHIAVPGPENIRPSDWGAVVDFPPEWWNDDRLQDLFGVNRATLLTDELKVPPANHAPCRPCLVRIGAACDHAQGRRGPLTYLFGLEIPAEVQRIKVNNKVPVPASEWSGPFFLLDGVPAAFTLHVNCRFPLSITASKCAAWTPRYRLREQILITLITHANSYLSRPGILRV